MGRDEGNDDGSLKQEEDEEALGEEGDEAAAAVAEADNRPAVRRSGRPRKNVHELPPRPPPRAVKHHEDNGAAVTADSDGEDALTDPDSQRKQLRKMWELASVLNFLHTFREVLHVTVSCTVEDLESALIHPNTTLADLHIDILRGVSPKLKSSVNYDSWHQYLRTKTRFQLQELLGQHEFAIIERGRESEAYAKLSAPQRVRLLLAICELRSDCADVQSYICEAMKKGGSGADYFRPGPLGNDSAGNMYWYELDDICGWRMYKEAPWWTGKNKQSGTGRRALPPTQASWDVAASSCEEFRQLGDKLANSRHKGEAKLGRMVLTDLVPGLEDKEKKREKELKKQQRAHHQLEKFVPMWAQTSLRPRRERKPVSYTFEAYEQSIAEAIRKTNRTRDSSSPEKGSRQRMREAQLRRPNPMDEVAQGMRRGRSAGLDASTSHASDHFVVNGNGHDTHDILYHTGPVHYEESDLEEHYNGHSNDNKEEASDRDWHGIEGDEVEDEEVYHEHQNGKRKREDEDFSYERRPRSFRHHPSVGPAPTRVSSRVKRQVVRNDFSYASSNDGIDESGDEQRRQAAMDGPSASTRPRRQAALQEAHNAQYVSGSELDEEDAIEEATPAGPSLKRITLRVMNGAAQRPYVSDEDEDCGPVAAHQSEGGGHYVEDDEDDVEDADEDEQDYEEEERGHTPPSDAGRTDPNLEFDSSPLLPRDSKMDSQQHKSVPKNGFG
eukprot:jgi/Chlat1/6397/Chrsp45S05911